jgi:hypothetical protein
MPLTFVGNQFGGFRASGWAWLLNLVVLAPLVLSGPLPVRAVRRLSPYLAFLGLCGPILAYVLAWRAADRADQVLDILLRLGCHPHRRADAQSQVNSVRRREAWPALIEACSDAPITGHGAGSSAQISEDISSGGFGQPTTIACEPTATRDWWAASCPGVLPRRRGAFRPAGGPGRGPPAPCGGRVAGCRLPPVRVTDNPMAYTAHFMTPLAVVLDLSDVASYRRRAPGHRRVALRAPAAFAASAGEAASPMRQ